MDPELSSYAAAREALRDVVPPDFDSLDPHAYVPAAQVLGRGVDLREEEQVARVQSWRGLMAELLRELRSDARINVLAMGEDYLHNGQYPTPDAECYTAMIADYKPRRIVEIGAGYSTAIARKTIGALGLDCSLVVVDPEPRAEVSDQADIVLQTRIEALDRSELSFDDRTLLFVDSSHVVRAGGDVPLILCDLIPGLPNGALVHVHDVFIPYDYPDAYKRRLYGEQYVLWALLTNAPAYRVVLATHYMVRTHTQLMQEVFGQIVGANPEYYGASFWFEVHGATS